MSSNDDFTTENFKANLKLASSYYPSISEMCRKLEINRQQFMKYLSGASFPSRYNLRRICDFFGVDEFEILMPHEQFSDIIRLRPTQNNDKVELPPGLEGLLKETQNNRNILSKMHGYYYEYYLSFSRPGKILRTLTYVYGWKDYTLYKRLERLATPESTGRPEIYKYQGIISMIGDRMNMFDQETVSGSELTQKVLYPNYRNRITMLTGLILGVSAGDAHEPSTSRVVMEYIGRSTSTKQALSECGIYTEDSPHIPRAISAYLTCGGRTHEPLRATTFNPKSTD